MTASPWKDILTLAQIAVHHALNASIDPAFAARNRAFYESRTLSQLRALSDGAWAANDSTIYQMARSYAAQWVTA